MRKGTDTIQADIFHSTPTGEIRDDTPIAVYRNDVRGISKEVTVSFLKEFI
jgi:hypothetical protein